MVIHATARAVLDGIFSIWILLQMVGCSTSQEVAQNSLATLHKLSTSAERADDEAFAKDIGFETLEEVADAQLASPLRLYTISLVKLASFQPGDDPNKLLEDTYSLIFPVTIDKHYRSSLIVKETSLPKIYWTSPTKSIDSMKARHTGTGYHRLMTKIEELQPASSSFLVTLAPLGLILLGDRNADELVLTSIEENQCFELKAGEKRSAAELFNKLAHTAKRVYESDQLLRRTSPDEAPSKRPNTERWSCLHLKQPKP
jgi:hypothetical protein